MTDSLANSMEAYLREEWHSREFRMRFIPTLGRTGVIMDRDYATEEQFKTLDYYKFLRQFNMGHSAIVTFPAGNSPIFLVLQRHLDVGPFDEEERVLLQDVRRKLISATMIMQGLAAQKVAGMSAAFEMANVGCIFFDRSGRVTSLNAKAQTYLGNDLQISNGQLRPCFPGDALRFRTEMNRMLSGPQEPLNDTGTVFLSRADKCPLIVRLQRLSGHMLDVFSSASVVALIDDPHRPYRPPLKVVRDMFGLTAVEAEIALRLAEGASPREIGEERSISYLTVRTHIRTIFQKTDTNRQSELTALLTRMRF
ncbi:hypothetical protein GCM10010520_60540 [Rhizobium viscosum]|uniref:DNA-binding CsgD family transcriptional regulator n=1 Tax=Rhizobium viscosum TaxID=1673 RepID=A0ABR9IUI7_RHIVS|nr:helix-turn-helix transcriptional regulator [Rhizobium viscosum]MBE1506879.1 DNA-binding CsgD family transcriptional regulator [Rhizobium viscosum]